jgi:hypothetical protein
MGCAPGRYPASVTVTVTTATTGSARATDETATTDSMTVAESDSGLRTMSP